MFFTFKLFLLNVCAPWALILTGLAMMAAARSGLIVAGYDAIWRKPTLTRVSLWQSRSLIPRLASRDKNLPTGLHDAIAAEAVDR